MPLAARIVCANAVLALGWFGSGFVENLARFFRHSAAWVGLEMAGLQVGVLAMALAAVCLLGGRASDHLGLGPGRLPWSAVLALGLGTLGLSHLVDLGLWMWARPALEGSVAVGIAREMRTAQGADLLVAFVGSALAPGVCEELLCRGVVQRNALRWMGPAAAIALSALVFGALHREWVHGGIAATIGVYLGVAALWADSTRPAIFAHVLNNAVALFGSLGVLRLSASPLVSGPCALVLAVGGMWWAWRTRPTPRGGPGETLQPRPESADA